jgi:hypothetical protein
MYRAYRNKKTVCEIARPRSRAKFYGQFLKRTYVLIRTYADDSPLVRYRSYMQRSQDSVSMVDIILLQTTTYNFKLGPALILYIILPLF